VRKANIPMTITYAIAHVLLFIAWAQLIYAGLFAENITIYTVLAVVVGAALATIQLAAILQDIEHESEDAHDSN